MAIMEVKGLTLGYENSALVRDLDFKIEKGDYLCIVGENGAGKSTLMKTILRLRKPMAGEIIYGEGLKATEIGYLPQQTPVQKDFPASVREVVLSGCQNSLSRHIFYGRGARERALANMERMGIAKLSGKCYRELSGGQQQRVLLARALCATERMLLMDEPVSGLDPMASSELYEIIKKLNKEGITIIMVSHDIASALKYAGKILHIGADHYFGTVEEYMDSRPGRAYLERSEEDNG